MYFTLLINVGVVVVVCFTSIIQYLILLPQINKKQINSEVTFKMMGHYTSGRWAYKAREVPNPPPLPQNEIHLGVLCDGCDCRVEGIRYRCSTCPDFDFCTSCMFANDVTPNHEESHVFVRLTKKQSDSKLFMSKADWIHPDVECAKCNTLPIVGYRYFCTACGTSLCEYCEQHGLHDITHAMLKMPPPSLFKKEAVEAAQQQPSETP
jgi:hypothetical protein